MSALENSLTEAAKSDDRDGHPEKIGEFAIERRLGSGSHGLVLLARDPALDRPVAIKLLADHLRDTTAVERMLREARALARIRHENVIAVHASGMHDSRPWVAMEYVPGGDLRERLDDPELRRPEVALRLMTEAARGLEAAAREGILHRDVKPANLLLGKDDKVLVADFGLSRDHAVDSSLTATGVVPGTPLYVAPEMIREGQGDERSDIYSWGATAFHLLCGRPPFEGKTVGATLLMHASDPVPDLRALAPEVPDGLIALVTRCLAKDPDARPASWLTLLEDLEAVREGRAPSLARAPTVRVLADRTPDRSDAAGPENARTVKVGPARARSTAPTRPRATIAPVPSKPGEPAGGTRGLAFLVDGLLLAIASFLLAGWCEGLGVGHGRDLVWHCFLLLGFGFEFFDLAPARALLGNRLRASEGGPPGLFRRTTRFLLTRPQYAIFVAALSPADGISAALLVALFVLLVLVTIVDVSVAAGSARNRVLHDMLSGTVMEKAPRERLNAGEHSLLSAYLLWLPPLGLLGLHRYYLDRPLSGSAFLLSGGFFGIGWALDLLCLPALTREANEQHALSLRDAPR